MQAVGEVHGRFPADFAHERRLEGELELLRSIDHFLPVSTQGTV